MFYKIFTPIMAVSMAFTGLITTTNVKTFALTDDTKANISSIRAENQAQKCDKVTARINNQIEKFNANKDKHIQNYQNTKDKVTDMVTRVKNEKGADTTKLEADLKTLDSKIQTFASDYATFIKTLESTKTLACGNSDGEFKNALALSRTQLATSKQDAAAVRSFIKDTIRPDVQAIRDQIKA